MDRIKRFFGSNAELALVVGVVLILLVLFAPIPPALLDLLLITNFAFALTILLLTFYVARPVEFSTFPSLLLVATLFRLSLNVAATRLILSSAGAGEVIGSIGSYAVQGNFIIGLVVFFILVVVQYVVVTNGAQRVSEVAARFVLDAMPGQQMSIDADLNMGMITQAEAKQRRKDLEKEASFYGAMDGASKFVKGDAIAGVIILLIDILGGWLVGVAQMGMNWNQALQTFTLLTVGDGIVTQVPALIVSVATGIIVTRSSADRQLSLEVLRQLVLYPRIQVVVMVALIALLGLPGMPKWPIAILLPLIAVAWFASRSRSKAAATEAALEPESKADARAGPDTPPAIEIGLGKTLSLAWGPIQAALGERVLALREQFAAESGLLIPPITFRDSGRVGPADYEVLLLGNRYAQATIYPERILAIRASDGADTISGIATRDPAFSLPAVWIEASSAERARTLGYTLVDPITVLMTHLTELVKLHAPTLLSRADVVRLLEGVRTRQPGLVEELVPNILAVSDVQRTFQNLLSEGVSIRNIDLIVEALVDVGRHQKDVILLTELARQRIGNTICHSLRGNHDALSVMTLDPTLEATMARNINSSEGGSAYLLEARSAEQLLLRLMSVAEAMMRQSLMPVLLCAPDLRRHVKTFTRRTVPRLAVLSVGEVPYSIELKSFGIISITSPVTTMFDLTAVP